jgi:hypothetical protein
MNLHIGKVIQTHPKANMVDVMLTDGTIMSKIECLSPLASANEGLYDLPVPNPADPTAPFKDSVDLETNDVWAVVAEIDNWNTVCLGFIFPERNQVLCDEPGLHLFKHNSDVYHRIDKDGNVELHHPSGTFIKVGSNTAKTPVVNWDADKGRPFDEGSVDPDTTYVHVEHESGATVTILPSGKVEVKAEGIELDGEGFGVGTIGGVVCSKHFCPVTGRTYDNMAGKIGTGGNVHATKVTASKE